MEIVVGVILGLLVLGVAALLLDQKKRAAQPGSVAPSPAPAAPPAPGGSAPLGVMTPEGFFGVHAEPTPEPPADEVGPPPEAAPGEEATEPWALPDEDAETEFLVSQQEELEPPPPDVATLISVLRGGSSTACREAVDDLVRHGPSALPALEAALSDPDPDVRIDVQRAIDRIREGA